MPQSKLQTESQREIDREIDREIERESESNFVDNKIKEHLTVCQGHHEAVLLAERRLISIMLGILGIMLVAAISLASSAIWWVGNIQKDVEVLKVRQESVLKTLDYQKTIDDNQDNIINNSRIDIEKMIPMIRDVVRQELDRVKK